MIDITLQHWPGQSEGIALPPVALQSFLPQAVPCFVYALLYLCIYAVPVAFSAPTALQRAMSRRLTSLGRVGGLRPRALKSSRCSSTTSFSRPKKSYCIMRNGQGTHGVGG